MSWEVVVHKLALPEVKRLKERNTDAFNDLIDEFQLLADSRDPRRCCNVKEIKHDAPGWFRLALYKHNIRVVFRIVQLVGGEYVEIYGWQPLDDNADKNFIEITRLAHRSNVYGVALKVRLVNI